MWAHQIQTVLIDAGAIQEKVRRLGEQISRDYRADDPPILVGILKGSLYFLSDLSRSIALPVEIEVMSVSSYGSSTHTSGVVRILKDLDTDIADRHVLIVEDIVDTGLTLDFLLRSLKTRAPRSLKVCALLDKPACRRIPVPISYLGFSIPDAFVVGYGLDYNQRYRNLPYIATLPSGG